MIATNETFTERTVHLDGGDFKSCKFIRCKMVYSGLRSLAMSGCQFHECEWAFEGPASHVVHFMTSMWAMGGGCRDVVESSFEQIRSVGTPASQKH